MRRANDIRRARGARTGVAVVGLTCAVLAAACGRDDGPLPARGAATGAATGQLPDLGALSHVPVGPLAGIAVSRARIAIHNPHDGDAAATGQGEYLYVHMNCAYCHGFDGGGGMGPNLADDFWRFGGDDAAVFNSIYEGRGKGMPAWGSAMTEDNIWKVVAYLRTLGGGSTSRSAQASNAEGPSGASRMASRGREPLKSMNENER